MNNKIQVLTEKLNRRYRFLTATSLRAFFICIIAVLDGIFYGLYCSEPWYIVLLDGIAALILAVSVIGLIIFILKPFLFVFRLISYRVNKRILKMEQEKCNENFSQLNKEFSNKIGENQEQTLQKYSENVQQIVHTKFQIRALELKRTKYAEWKWVLAAAIILFIGVVIAISIYLIIALFVLLFVICAFLATHDSGGHSRYKRERSSDLSDHDPFLIELFKKVSNSDKETSSEILRLQIQIQDMAAENRNILESSTEIPQEIFELFNNKSVLWASFVGSILSIALTSVFFIFKKRFLIKYMAVSAAMGIMTGISNIASNLFDMALGNFVFGITDALLSIVTFMWVFNLMILSFVPELRLVIRTKSAGEAIQIRKKVWFSFFYEPTEYTDFLEVLPWTDANQAIKEVNAIIGDLQTMGDFAIEKWKTN